MKRTMGLLLLAIPRITLAMRVRVTFLLSTLLQAE